MKIVEVITKNADEYSIINCPHCGNSESHPVDEQRHHLQNFEMVQWAKEINDCETSDMICLKCKKKFKAVWVYPHDLE